LRYTIAAKFRIGGNLRFLSHQETARLFHCALVRSRIKLIYSQGFNPRPRISLPLPRSVGLEGQAELMCALIEIDRENEIEDNVDIQQIRSRLERQLPQGCRLVSLELIKGKARFHPAAAVYEFELTGPALLEKTRLEAESRCIGNEHLFIERRIDEKGNTRVVDIGGYIKSVEFDSLKVAVTCGIEPSGTIRVDEILKLLGVDESMMLSGVKRTCIKWRTAVS